MAKGNAFAKHEDFKLEEGISLSKTEDGTIFQIKRYDVFYSETYDAPMLVLETKKGEIYYSFAEFIIDRIVKSLNTGISQKNKVVKVCQKVSKETEQEYTVLESLTPDELNEFKMAQFKSNPVKEEE